MKMAKQRWRGINVNCLSNKKTTPLIMAARNGQTETTRELLKLGANKDAVDENGKTALVFAKEKGKTASVKLLESWDTKKWNSLGEKLSVAAKEGDLAEVKKLVEAGAPIEYQDKDLDSVLNNASWKGRTEVVKYLISKGSRLESPNAKNISALHHAAYKGHFDTVVLLIKSRANINARSNKGSTPISMAEKHGHDKICSVLREYGANSNVTNQATKISGNIIEPKDNNDKDVEVEQKEKPNALLMDVQSKKIVERNVDYDEVKENLTEKIERVTNDARDSLKKYRQMIEELKKQKNIQFHAFLSHAQADTQDVVALLAMQLTTNHGMKVWLNMEAANLNVEGMVQRVGESETFVLFATRNYMVRPFSVFELLVAMELGKKIQIVWAPDTRHNGFANFRDFMNMVPAEFASMFETEAIDYQRREPKKSVQLSLLANRLKGSMPISSWSAADFLSWVMNLGPVFEKYRNVLKNEAMEGRDVIDGTYTKDELEELGISKAHARKIIKKAHELVPNL